MLRMTCRHLVCMAIVVLAACAAPSPRPVITPEPFESSQACYRCLEARLHQAPNDPYRVDRLVLLAVRARELGLEDLQWLALLDEEAQSPGRGLALAPLRDVLRDWPADASGWDPDRRLVQARRQRTRGERVAEVERAIGGAGLAPVVGQYLRQSFRCRAQRLEPTPEDLDAWSQDPLLTYGAAACPIALPAPLRERLERLAAADTRWVEADVALARLDIAGRRMSAAAERRLARAVAEFPESTALWLALGQLRQAHAETAAALDAFDAVVRAVPDHREALLGRVLSLSHLARHEEAITAASRLIDLGTYHIGDAHYWRAWSRYRLGRLDEARADSERALTLLYGTDAFTLSGLIELARGDTTAAIKRFETAVSLDGANCLARTQLGVSHRQAAAADRAGAAFEAAMACHAEEAGRRRRELDDLRAGGDASAAHLRSVEQAAEDGLRAEAEAALQAADTWASAGRPDRALAALGPARRHPATRDEAERLAARIRPDA